jgi:hypothetical protein
MMSPPPDQIIFCYGEYQPIFREYPEVQFVDGLPDMSAPQFNGQKHTLLIIDDLMSEAGSNDTVCNIFTKFSHHRNISVIFLTQNLFYKNKYSRTMSLNAQYIVIFKNPRDTLQITTLARQMHPGNGKFLVEAFRDATQRSYGYLLIDLKPETDEKIRIRTNIFPDEIQHVYIPK